MNANRVHLLLLLPAMAFCGASAQEVAVLFVERSHAIFQDGSNSSLPIESAGWGGWSNYFLIAGAEVDSGTISNFRIAGPASPLGEPIPYEGPDDGYALEVGFSTAQQLSNEMSAGTYTFSGTGSTVGVFSENVYLGTYSPLTNRLLTNYTELQSFNGLHPVTLEWQEFVQGQGSGGGLIEISIRYGDAFYETEVWNSDSIPSENPFGLDPTVTSVEIPAGVLVGSPDGIYDVAMFFIRIETLEELGSESKLEGALLASITGLEMYTRIRSEGIPNPLRLYLSPGAWIWDEALGYIYGYSSDWGYSPGFGFINVSQTPYWVYQETLGWLAPMGTGYYTGLWLYGESVGWLWTSEGLGSGWYWSMDQDGFFNMNNP